MTENQTTIIKDWIKDSKRLLKCYLSKAEKIRRNYKIIGISSAILSTFVGSSIFASIGQDESNTSLLIITGLVSLSATLLTSILAFLKMPELANKCHISGNEYASIRKELELLLEFDSSDDEYVKNQIKQIKLKWDDVRNNSIPISAKYIAKFDKN